MPYKNIEDRRANERKKRLDPEHRKKMRAWQQAYRDRGGKRQEYLRLKADKKRFNANREGQRQLRVRTRLKAIDMYGGKCACCGETESVFLAIDHIHGGGQKQRMKVAGKPSGGINLTKFFNWLICLGRPRKGFRVLCHNCNFATRYGAPCPHSTAR